MKKVIVFIMLIATMALTACGSTTIVHCDDCGAEIKVHDDKVTEDWILFCDKCAPEHEQAINDALNAK